MTVSIIQKSQLEGALRLDAEYYQPEYLGVREKLRFSPALDDISKKITDFGAYSQMNFVKYEKTGVRFLRNQDVGEVFIDDSEQIFISEEAYAKLSLKLEEYDIVTPRVGTLGNAAVLFKQHLPASANQNLAQIKPDIAIVDPVYLSVFLSSKYGRLQFDQLATGNVQLWLNLSQIKSIKVFLPPLEIQKSIAEFALEALEEKENSKSLYSQAENLLLEELGLENFSARGGSAFVGESENELWSVVNFSEVKKANRVDAEYFQPKYKELLELLKKSKSLVEIAKRVKRRAEIVPQREYNYIEISDVNAGSGEIVSNPVFGKELPANAKIKITGGELLISKVRPTRGAVTIVPEEWKKDFIASGAFSVFDVPSPVREYLQVVLRSVVGKLQMERPTTGTSYPTVTDTDIENVSIPILSDVIQQKIAELVRQSHEARKKSKELLKEAKHKVEKLIEAK